MKGDPEAGKISRELTARLRRLAPQQKVRAIILLRFDEPGVAHRRQSQAERQATIDSVRRSAENALPEIDQILGRFEGKRLTEDIDALGGIPIETVSAGITALATSEHVKAILEDQTISSLHGLRH